MCSLDNIDKERAPKHVAIIMDGNGRWAKQRGNKRIFGHEHGVDAVREATEAAGKSGVKYLTLYAFSTENWNRPQDEVDGLMRLLIEAINGEIDSLLKNDIKLLTIGNTKALPADVQEKLQLAIEQTSKGNSLTLIIALNYGSQQEIVEASKRIASDCITGKLTPNDITKETFSQYLYTANFPNPELMIRTSGEYRLSNFLLWQLSYAEFYFTPTLWPDFTKEDFYKAIVEFQHRNRRFGGVGPSL